MQHHSDRNQRLRIGLTAKSGAEAWVQKHSQNYLNVLRTHNVEPILLAPDTAAELPGTVGFEPGDDGRIPLEILHYLDGLLLAGGGDVHPRYFGEEIAGADVERIDIRRDELELSLCSRALELDMPILAICRGCQVLNVAAGGGMVQDFPNHRSDTANPELHALFLEPDSGFARLIQSETLDVNSYHHQGIDDRTLAPGLLPAARAVEDPWLIEAIESREHRWVLGVQWHPERLFELPAEHRTLWSDFLRACAEHHSDRSRAHAHRTL